MKKIIILTLTLLTAPLFAGLNCIDNSEHLQFGSFDTKEWHAVDCICPCSTIRNGICVECGHLQNARPLTIVKKSTTEALFNSRLLGTQTVKETIKSLVRDYLNTH